MAKATPLSAALMTPAASEPLKPRPLATNPTTLKAEERAKPKIEKITPLQVRWPDAEVKAMKRAALDADMTYSEYLLACFHAYKKA